ncbi:MAG TPA: hypothetical protein PKM21_00430 [Anaerolineales bacterium]|nr:hypothetical protein [Anaerolineales bacterium]
MDSSANGEHICNTGTGGSGGNMVAVGSGAAVITGEGSVAVGRDSGKTAWGDNGVMTEASVATVGATEYAGWQAAAKSKTIPQSNLQILTCPIIYPKAKVKPWYHMVSPLL